VKKSGRLGQTDETNFDASANYEMSNNVKQQIARKDVQFGMRMPQVTRVAVSVASAAYGWSPSAYVLRATQEKIARDVSDGRIAL